MKIIVNFAGMRRLFHNLMLGALLFLTAACSKESRFDIDTRRSTPDSGGRAETETRAIPATDRRVMLMVFGGRNNLARYLREDVATLEASDIPGSNYLSDDVLLVLSRVTKAGESTSQPCPAVLYQLYKGRDGAPVRDTLKVWDDFEPVFGSNMIEESLTLAWNRYPAAGYGLVLSSHASGWLPAKYYADPAAYERDHPVTSSIRPMARRLTDIARESFPPVPAFPAVKSIGQDVDLSSSEEMELTDFVGSIPFKLDYILLDACLNGCVEVAWALKDKARYVGFSPTEVLADGFDYSLLTTRLLQPRPDPQAVLEDYMAQYKKNSQSPWATISLVDTEKLDDLAAACAPLFEKYRSALRHLPGDLVQRYFRANYHFYYDLRDILVKVGIDADELATLDAALDACVVYKDCTPTFFSIEMVSYSGLSMYLPSMGSAVLDKFYKENITWNDASGLIN